MNYVAAGSAMRRAGSSVVRRQYGIPCRPGQGLGTRGRFCQSRHHVQGRCFSVVSEEWNPHCQEWYSGILEGWTRLKIRRSRRGRRVAGIKWNQESSDASQGSKNPASQGHRSPPLKAHLLSRARPRL